MDPENTLHVALEAYWTEGIHKMSLNEVCRRAKVSKPGLYREFGGEDGLMATVLTRYAELVLPTWWSLLASDMKAERVLADLVDACIGREGYPSGCLVAEMTLAASALGPQTTAILSTLCGEIESRLERWVQSAQEAHEIGQSVPPDTAARHIASQMVLVAIQARRGREAEHLRAEAELSLRCYTARPLWSA